MGTKIEISLSDVNAEDRRKAQLAAFRAVLRDLYKREAVHRFPQLYSPAERVKAGLVGEQAAVAALPAPEGESEAA